MAAATMFTVALIGPDGAGKTTVARRLEQALGMPAKYLYMGVNWEASEHLLPTTRLIQAIRRARGKAPEPGGPPPGSPVVVPQRSFRGRVLGSAWRGLSLANRLAEEWYRQLVAWSYVRRGFVVVFDRHFFSDYHAYDVAARGARSFDRRIHGFLLSRVYPKPSLVVYLDAPPELLLERKGEGTLESLNRRRQEYLELAHLTRHFVAVDASQPLDQVVRDVTDAIESFAASSSKRKRTASATNERV